MSTIDWALHVGAVSPNTDWLRPGGSCPSDFNSLGCRGDGIIGGSPRFTS